MIGVAGIVGVIELLRELLALFGLIYPDHGCPTPPVIEVLHVSVLYIGHRHIQRKVPGIEPSLTSRYAQYEQALADQLSNHGQCLLLYLRHRRSVSRILAEECAMDLSEGDRV